MNEYVVNSDDLKDIADAIDGRPQGVRPDFQFPDDYVQGIQNIEVADFKQQFLERTLVEVQNNNVLVIGSYAFHNCTSLTSVLFPACTTIEDYAFWYCRSLTSASFPACTAIGTSAFYSCTSLTSVSFPACETIGSSAFRGCTSLTSVSFSACTTIRYSAFEGCTFLTSVSFPACTTVENRAFYNCRSLTSVSFPMCTTIESNAFYYCTGLISLNLTGVSSVPTLGASAFYYTPIGGYSAVAGQYGSVYVPASLYTAFTTATNWSSISSRIVSV